jgi:hypothetical protein
LKLSRKSIDLSLSSGNRILGKAIGCNASWRTPAVLGGKAKARVNPKIWTKINKMIELMRFIEETNVTQASFRGIS